MLAGIAILCGVILAFVYFRSTAGLNVRCQAQIQHVANLSRWVQRLQDNDRRITRYASPNTVPWVRNRIEIFGEYLKEEKAIDYGWCP